MVKKKDPDKKSKIIRTISSFVPTGDKVKNNIFAFMTRESKNIYNVTLFHTNLFLKYQNLIFKDLLLMVNQKKIIHPLQLDDNFYKLYNKYYELDMLHKPIIEKNNKIIYNFITNYLIQNNIILINDNVLEIEKDIIKKIERKNIVNIRYPEYKNELFLNIVRNILKSIYSRNFNKLKNDMLHKKPFSITNKNFINQVRNGDYFFKEKIIKNYKKILQSHALFAPPKKINGKLKKKKEVSAIKSNQNYISRNVYKYFTNCKIPSDLMCNIIAKAYSAYSSYFELRKNGHYASKPRYLDKNAHFILPFFERSRKLNNEKGLYRLTIGKYISAHYNNVVDNNQYICLNNDQSSDYKKYVLKKYLTYQRDMKGIFKKDNFIIGNYFINKTSTHIIDTYYINVVEPKKIKDKKLLLIEIIPILGDGKNFKINFSYEEPIKNNKLKKNKIISIDLGMGNLMAIHDPEGPQHLIKGAHIKNINNYYNVLIDEHKSELSKYNKNNIKNEKKESKLPPSTDPQKKINIPKNIINMMNRAEKIFNQPITNRIPCSIRETKKSNIMKDLYSKLDYIEELEKNPNKNVLFNKSLKTSAQLRKLLRQRTDAINNHFNEIVNWILNKYKDCETIIVGYNEGWKTKVNMGKKTNRKFYEIPYRRLLDKLKNKLEINNQKLIIIDESYTSKCDSLGLEDICYHKKYLGKRIKRGLFSSSTKVLLNADINGAINIMRKWKIRNGFKDRKTTGINLCNPITVKLSDLNGL